MKLELWQIVVLVMLGIICWAVIYKLTVFLFEWSASP